MSNEIDWREYEALKAQLQLRGLPPEQYEAELRRIVKDLEREADERAAEEEAEAAYA